MNITIIAGAVAGIVGFGLAWQLQAGNIAQLKLEQKDERISQQRAARQTLERSMQTFAKADSDAATRATRNRADAGRAGDSGNGLRIKTADAVRSAASDPAACSERAAALGKLFTASTDEYRKLAEIADRHSSDSQTLVDAWPR